MSAITFVAGGLALFLAGLAIGLAAGRHALAAALAERDRLHNSLRNMHPSSMHRSLRIVR